MFSNILVPTDGSECAERALEHAADLAGRSEAAVHVLSVADSRWIDTGPTADVMRETAREWIAAATERIDSVDTETAVRTGIPYEAILEYIATEGIDLVVMGTHGRTGVDRFLLGSITEKVLRRSEIPVLTVRDGDPTYPYTKILVPTDGSTEAATAIPPAVAIASLYGARLHALSVVDTRSLGVDIRSTVVLDALEQQAHEAVSAVTDRATSEGCPEPETAIEFGLPYRQIREYIESNEIDLVVMGTHGRSGLARHLLGSVTEKLVRSSPAPVLVVPGNNRTSD